ncbi:MAG: glutamate synthase large subunit [Klebsiella pneumoniae]|nr:glutamate synthase large subunit [Klebsiella pneumoniae]
MLYDKSLERDNCGFGLIAHIEGEPSHKVVRTAIHALARMQHRGAILADGKTGDGCGLLLQKPDRFFRIVAEERGWRLAKNYAVGMLFLNKDPELAKAARRIVEEELQLETLSIVGWRDVPTNEGVLGEIALSSLPRIEQIFVNAPAGWRPRDMERRLFIARRRIEKRLQEDKDFYVCSLSNLVNIYKGLCMPADLPRFYLDLADLRLESAICLFHQRFSTNTVPRWPLAQPFRYLAHNGEINTITGNRQWARARTYKFQTPLIPDLHDAAPFVNETGSDSSSMDNMLELLLAGIVMSDGRYAACNLDRNGLRPARYVITKDKLITCASEVGIWDYQPDEVVEKGRVGPGELMVIDTRAGRILHSAETDDDLKSRHPYKEWMEKNVRRLVPFEDLPDEEVGSRQLDDDTLASYQKQFNYSAEELDSVLRVLGENGQEAVGSMGDDTPFAVLSSQPRIIYDYFRQQFAQVTNPPIDPLREAHVMSLATSIGREMNVFCEAEGQAHRLSFKSPILLYSDFKQLTTMEEEHYRADVLDITFNPAEASLSETVKALCDKAEQMVRDGTVLLVLSDRNIAKDRLPVPAPMAVGAIQTRLVDKSLRCDANIIVETASARDPHHFAVLLGFGATAIYPYLAYETLAKLVDSKAIDKPYRAVMLNYRNGINKGLYKIMSKMGISTIASYRCSKLFEAVGLHRDVSDLCFQGVVSRIGGASFDDFQQDLLNLSKRAWLARKPLAQGGLLKYVHGGEYHAYNPDVVRTLQQAVQSGEYSDYQQYAKLVNERPAATLRDLLALNPGEDAISIDEVEPAKELFIFDLKQVNPKAMISVKLVSEPGVGTIATGVAKAYADLITIAGYDGGTGASPLSSVKYAGCPWELGLVETQQALVANGLRHKIRLQVDGGLKTGLDIIKAAILGAESFGFGTGPMVALGCKYLRICHLNNCATGVATQDDKLRKNHYHGLPFKVTNYFEFIARETRELMAQLGVKRLVDLIGRTDLLKELDGFTAKQQKLDLGKLLETAEPHPGKALYCTENNPPFDNGVLNAQLLQQAKPYVDEKQSKTFWFDIRNTDRSVGASLSGYIAQTHGDQGLAGDPIVAHFSGTAGQSFGVWNAGGVELHLTGDANDYVGKGMAGGLLAIRPPVGSAFRSHEASIIGNTCLYGATGGRLYAAGRAGERFAVRNSGAITVVEGIGDNGCEYMTGGIVCVLGKTGVNFGAGMTGGFAYVLDEDGDFRKRVNPELVEVLDVDSLAIHEEHLRGLITEHVQLTGSQRGEEILANWPAFSAKFALVKPKSSDVKALLGHRSRSAAELRVQAQ